MLKYRLIPANSGSALEPVPPGVATNQLVPTAAMVYPPQAAVQPQMAAPLVENEEKKKKKSLEDIVELFPPRLRNKARLMLVHAWNRISITEDNHVLYGGGDGEDSRQGSSIYDLVRFFITPSPPGRGNQTRPPDAFEFGKILLEAGTPLASYGHGKSDFVTRIQSTSPSVSEITVMSAEDQKKQKNKKTTKQKTQAATTTGGIVRKWQKL